MSAFWQGTAIERTDWFSPSDPQGVSHTPPRHARDTTVRARTLEEWVWQTLESVAGGAGARSIDAEDEAPEPNQGDEHLVSMVTSITFSSS